MPPADSTEGCAAQGPISTAHKKRSLGIAHLATPRGKGRKGVSALREMCGSSMPLSRSKGALTEHPPGAGAPTGHPPGGYSVPYSGKPTKPVPYSGKPTDSAQRPRFGKHVLGLRLSATLSDHAFRPRQSHAFQPRLSATPSGHVFRRAIRIEDVVLLSQQLFQATNRRPQLQCRVDIHHDSNVIQLMVLDAVKHHDRSHSHDQDIRFRMMSNRSKGLRPSRTEPSS